MFPFVYDFSWSAGALIFLGIFFSVIGIVISTVLKSTVRTIKDIRANRVETIRWHGSFEELPLSGKHCRHELLGTVSTRICDNHFDCGHCQTHPHLKALETAQAVLAPAAEQTVYGFSMPQDRLYHRGHTWVQEQENGSLLIGLDDFARRLFGTETTFELPVIGSSLTVNGIAFLARAGKSLVRVLSPVEGKVVGTGGPADEWLLRIMPMEREPNLEHLFRAEEVKPWILREMERLEQLVSVGGVGVTLADGGTPVENFREASPRTNWDSVCGELMLDA